MIGTVLANTYRITRMIGEGGMARLYEAEHLRLDAKYAIKLMHDELARDPAQLARFQREARAAGRVRDEHVVQMIDVIETDDGRPCLVQELLEGEDLQTVLDRQKKLDVATAIPIARQVCCAVAAAHAAGVVHRDLKPANVFLCKGGVVKVLDFGIAKVENDDRLTRTDAVMGTAAYMAPEQARSATDAGPLADVYSIGAILYHMLSGQPPYGDAPAISRYALVLHEEPARPRSIEPSIPDGVEAVIQGAMARDRDVRTQSAVELEARLAVFDTSKPGSALTPVPTSEVTTATAVRIAKRARATRPIAIALATASALGATAWTAALLTAIDAPKSTGESALIALIALAVLVAVVFLQVRRLGARWSSTTSITRQTKPIARAFVAGVTTLGTLELAAYGTRALLHWDLLGIPGRLAIAGLAALLGLGYERLGLEVRLRRWIG